MGQTSTHRHGPRNRADGRPVHFAADDPIGNITHILNAPGAGGGFHVSISTVKRHDIASMQCCVAVSVVLEPTRVRVGSCGDRDFLDPSREVVAIERRDRDTGDFAYLFHPVAVLARIRVRTRHTSARGRELARAVGETVGAVVVPTGSDVAFTS